MRTIGINYKDGKGVKMNYEQANSVKELAAPVNKVLERLEFVEYLKKQKGGIVTNWKWQPKVGEWAIYELGTEVESVVLISDIGGWNNDKPMIKGQAHLIRSYTPILEWETIEAVLEKAGYYLSIFEHTKEGSSWEKESWQVWICAKKEKDRITPKWFSPNLSRREAVYRAVIELGKEIKK